VGLVKELTLLWIRGTELCLTIVGTPPRGPLHEGMRFVASYHTKVVVQLCTLYVPVSSAAQFVLGHLPTEASQVDIVWRCLPSSGSRQSIACTSRIPA
jgi:hypothetical protein